METQEYFQSLVAAFTSFTIFFAVIFGPESIFTGSFCPVASTLMCLPPTSMTRMLFSCFSMAAPCHQVTLDDSKQCIPPFGLSPTILSLRAKRGISPFTVHENRREIPRFAWNDGKWLLLFQYAGKPISYPSFFPTPPSVRTSDPMRSG